MTITADTAPARPEDVQIVDTIVEMQEADGKSFPCPDGCGKSFASNLNLGNHRRVHGYVSPNPKPKKAKAVVPPTVKALDDTLAAMRERLLEVLGGGTEVGRLTTENIRMASDLRQARTAVDKAKQQHNAVVKKLKAKNEALAKRTQHAESQWFEDEKLLEEIIHILTTHSPLTAFAAITGVLPVRLLSADS